MTDLLRDAEARRNSPADSRASVPPQAGSSFLPTAALASPLLFFAVVILAGLIHPKIPAAVLALFVAFPLAGVVLGSIAKRNARRGSRPVPGRARFGVIAGGIELGLVLVAGLMLPTLCRAREPANRVKCASNLRQIGLALTTYANSEGGRFPPTLDVLLTSSDVTAEMFVCPSSNDVRAAGATPQEQAHSLRSDAACLSYVYVAADLPIDAATPDRVLVYEHAANHKSAGMNVLYGDGHVEFLAKADADRVISELNAGHNPPAIAKRP